MSSFLLLLDFIFIQIVSHHYIFVVFVLPLSFSCKWSNGEMCVCCPCCFLSCRLGGEGDLLLIVGASCSSSPQNIPPSLPFPSLPSLIFFHLLHHLQITSPHPRKKKKKRFEAIFIPTAPKIQNSKSTFTTFDIHSTPPSLAPPPPSLPPPIW